MAPIYGKESLITDQEKLKIFELVGGFRTTQALTCHKRSEQVGKTLGPKGYTITYLGVIWWEGVGEGEDHVCTVLKTKGDRDMVCDDDICVDVTIGQFPQLKNLVTDPPSDGMVFIGKKSEWVQCLLQMFGDGFKDHGERVDYSMDSLAWALNECTPPTGTSGKIEKPSISDAVDTPKNVKLKRTGHCIIL